MVSIDIGWSWFDLVKKVWVVADLLELHEHIQELDSVFASNAVNLVYVSCNNPLVQLLLQLCHSEKEVDFLLFGQLFFNIYFETSQHKWLEQPVYLLYDFLLLGWVFLLTFVHHKEIVEVLC